MADFVSALMSSTYNVIKTFCTDSRNNENLLRSNFSGTSFPSSPVVGQTCYREDLLKEYQWNGTSWVESGSNSVVSNEVTRSRGQLTSLDDRLAVSLNDDGTLRSNVVANISEWVISPLTVTYISTSSFSVSDDQTGVFTKDRLVRCELAASYVYASILNSSFSDGITSVFLDSSVIDNTFQQVSYSILQKQDEKYNKLLNFWQSGYNYAVGDIIRPKIHGSYKYLECTVGGQSGTVEPTWGDVGSTVTDGGVTWVVRDMRVADASDDNSTKKVTTSWLRTNIQSLVSGCITAVATAAGFACSLSANGYIKLPSWLGGLILQWGTAAYTNDPSTQQHVTFPITFPTAALWANVGKKDTYYTAGDRVLTFLSVTGLSFYDSSTNGDNNETTWIAIGK